jgi:hypothetical protein
VLPSRLTLVLPLLLLFACGAGRTIAKLPAPTLPAAQPQAIPFKLVVVRDARRFESKPRQADVPSLADPDVRDPALTARALGRKRGSFGKARGDYMLPAGETVASLVRAHVTAAVARAGGMVVEARDARFPQAIPLEVEITRFWSWLRPGAWQVEVEFDAALRIRAPLPGLEAGKAIAAHSELRRGSMTDARWIGVLREGTAQLGEQLAQELKRALATGRQ